MCAGGGSTGSTWDISVLLAQGFYESNTALKNKVNYKENHIHILLVLSVTLITLSVIRFFFFFLDKHHGKAHVTLRMLWRQKYGVAGHITFILRKRERRVIMLTCFLPFIHHPMAWCYLHSGCISPPQLNLSGNASDASSLPVLLVIPNWVKVPTIELSQLLSPNTDVTTFKGRLSFGSQFWRVRFILCWPQDLGTSTVS